MITQLDIENFALFKKSRMQFAPGLNVLSGESGAGKSLALESIAVLFGGRLSQERIGPFSDQVTLRAVIVLDPEDARWTPLAAAGLEPDPVLIVERVTGRDGRTSYRLQGQPVPAALVRGLGDSLLHYVGQNQLSKIFDADFMLDWVDNFAALGGPAAIVRELHRTYRALEDEVAALTQLGRAMGELDEKRRVRDELEALHVRAEEEDELASDLARLRAGRTLVETGQLLYQRLDGAAGILAGLDEAVRWAETLRRYDAAMADAAEALAGARAAVGDARLEIASWLEQLDLDPARLEVLEARADVLSRVKRRFGPSLSDVVQYQEVLQSEISRLENLDFDLSRSSRHRDNALMTLSQAADDLSRRRQAALTRASAALTEKIQAMEMPTGSIHIERSAQGVSARGVDALEVQFSASRGQALRPLAKVASGGEAARVALALAVVGQPRESVIFLFDEVDQGLGGASAERVGHLLRGLGEESQVLAVSHQAVVAALAHEHLGVSKTVEGQHSVAQVQGLTAAQRVFEIARMLSGSQDDRAMRHAEMLLKAGRRP